MVQLTRGKVRVAAVLVAAGLTLSGCRGVGHFAHGAYSWSSETLTPNPVTVGPYFTGLGLGFAAGLPLCLLSWPLSLLLYPEGEDEFFLSAALAPALVLGSVTGATLSAPLYPFGLPFLPEEP